MLILSDQQVRALVSTYQAVDVNEEAFELLHAGDADVPSRLLMHFPECEGVSLFKPCNVKTQEAFGIKLVHVRPRNKDCTTPATIVLFNRETGACRCLMNGTYLTALRTAAGSAVATRKVASDTAQKLLVFGAGIQAEAHIKTMCCVRSISQITIVNRTRPRAEKLAEQLSQELTGMCRNTQGHCIDEAPEFNILTMDNTDGIKQACAMADIICTTTGSATPLFDGDWVKPGAHINAVGSYEPHTTELDPKVIQRAKHLVVDTEAAWGAGDIGIPLESNFVKKEGAISLGELCNGTSCPVSSKKGDLTVYKAVGTAVQDMVTAELVYQAAQNSTDTSFVNVEI